jgi:hypothetical protein
VLYHQGEVHFGVIKASLRLRCQCKYRQGVFWVARSRQLQSRRSRVLLMTGGTTMGAHGSGLSVPLLVGQV